VCCDDVLLSSLCCQRLCQRVCCAVAAAGLGSAHLALPLSGHDIQILSAINHLHLLHRCAKAHARGVGPCVRSFQGQRHWELRQCLRGRCGQQDCLNRARLHKAVATPESSVTAGAPFVGGTALSVLHCSKWHAHWPFAQL
jgi:hypothetical protein